MEYKVYLTEKANADLEDLYEYLDKHSVDGRADEVLIKIERSIQNLISEPFRGVYPKELIELGIRDFRETYFKPYRIIYRIKNADVFVMMIADGRRDLQSLLQRRLLRG